MNVNRLLLEETIDKTIKELNELKKRNDIESVVVKINKYWMGDWYTTKFEVNYNIGKVNVIDDEK